MELIYLLKIRTFKRRPTLLPFQDVPQNEMVATVWDKKCSLGQSRSKIYEDIGINRIKNMKRIKNDSNL